MYQSIYTRSKTGIAMPESTISLKSLKCTASVCWRYEYGYV